MANRNINAHSRVDSGLNIADVLVVIISNLENVVLRVLME